MTADPIEHDPRRVIPRLGTLKHGNTPGNPWGAPRCGAKTRRGTFCQCPAMRGRRRCRIHGGANPGPPLGNRNGWKHGRRSAAAVAARKQRVARSRETLRDLAASELALRVVMDGYKPTPDEAAEVLALLERLKTKRRRG